MWWWRRRYPCSLSLHVAVHWGRICSPALCSALGTCLEALTHARYLHNVILACITNTRPDEETSYLLHKHHVCFIIWLESVSSHVYRVILEGRWSSRTVYRDGFSCLASPLGEMAVGRGESLAFTHGSPPSLIGSWQRYRVSCSTCCTHTTETKNISTSVSLNPPTLSAQWKATNTANFFTFHSPNCRVLWESGADMSWAA